MELSGFIQEECYFCGTWSQPVAARLTSFVGSFLSRKIVAIGKGFFSDDDIHDSTNLNDLTKMSAQN